MKIFLKEFIEEQAGFSPNRQIKDNLRVVIDTIEFYDKRPEKEVFFVDVEKAFDNLNCDFLMKFGGGFINAIKAIYYEQKAALCVNIDLTENFKVGKGTRQDCPLSPLLFVIVLEVLLRQIKGNQWIKN